jgi:hypothetical protein
MCDNFNYIVAIMLLLIVFFMYQTAKNLSYDVI